MIFYNMICPQFICIVETRENKKKMIILMTDGNYYLVLFYTYLKLELQSVILLSLPSLNVHSKVNDCFLFNLCN